MKLVRQIGITINYHITGYIQSRNFRRITKITLRRFYFYISKHNNFCSSASGVSKNFIFVEVMLFKNSKIELL